MSTEVREETEWAAPATSEYEVDERQLELLVRDWRKGRATRSLWAALQDAYIFLFAGTMILAMIVNVILQAQRVASVCSTSGCQSGRGLLPWAALAGALALTLAGCRLFGPVLASASEGFWLMAAPLRRQRLLHRRLWLSVSMALVAGALVGALVAALTGSSAALVLTWSAAMGLGSAGLTALAAAEQGAGRVWFVRALQSVAALGAVTALLMVVSTAAGWRVFDLASERTRVLALGVAGLGAVLLVGGMWLALARLARIERRSLMSGGSLAAGMQGAMFALDFGLMRDILVERRASERGSVRPTRGIGLGLKALMWRDLQRLLRSPQSLLPVVISVVVPYAVQALGLGSLNVIISAIVLMGALIPHFGMLRVLSRTKGLSRCLPYGNSDIRTAAMAVPAVVAMLWFAAVVPAFAGFGTQASSNVMNGVWTALVCAVAGLVGAIRWVSAKPADYSSPMLSTSVGAMPPNLIFNLLRGFDLVALIGFPALLGWSHWISLGLAFLCWTILRSGGMDREELMAQQEEQKRQMAELRAQSKAEKKATPTKVTRKQRR